MIRPLPIYWAITILGRLSLRSGPAVWIGNIKPGEHWSFVKKKQKNCRPEDTPQAGDFWDHTAIAPDSKLIVSLVVGKRTQEQTRALVSDTPSRLRKGHLSVLFSDGYEGYEPAILEALGRRYPAPKSGAKGRPRLDILRWPSRLSLWLGDQIGDQSAQRWHAS